MVIGQLGGSGSQINDAQSYLEESITVENAVVIKDYVLSKASGKQLVNIKGSGIYTYTSTSDIEVNGEGNLYVDHEST